MFNNLSMKYKIMIMSGIIITIGFSIIISFSIFKVKEISSKADFQKVDIMASKYANTFESDIKTALGQTKVLSNIFEEYESIDVTQRRPTYISNLKSIAFKNSEYFGVWSAWDENVIDNNDLFYKRQPGHNRNGRFVPYWNKIYSKEPILDQLVGFEELDFYKIPKETKKEFFSNPYELNIGDKRVMLATASYPIIKENKFLGVVGVDVDLSYFQNKIEKEKPLGFGYLMLISNDGQIVGHPQKSNIGKNITELYKELDLKKKILIKIKDGQNFNIIDNFKGENNGLYISFSTIKFGNADQRWSIALVYPVSKALKETYSVTFIMTVISLIILLISFDMIFLFGKKLANPIIKVSECLKEISTGEADLTKELPTITGDEIGDLAKNFNSFSMKLRNIISKIRGLGNNIYTMSQNISLNMENVLQGVELQKKDTEEMELKIENIRDDMQNIMDNIRQQAAAIEQTSCATEQMSQTIFSISNNAVNTKALSEVTMVKSQLGEQSVIDTLQKIDKIYEIVKRIEFKAKTLESSSIEIENILDFIKDIAGQTNLLSFNASIQAAHVGNAGKGFAVISNEIKNLSNRTAESVKKVGNIIKSIQIEVSDINKEIYCSYIQTEEVKALSEESVIKLREIRNSVDKSNIEVDFLCNSINEQSIVTDEITKAIADIAMGSSKIEDSAFIQLETLKESCNNIKSISEESKKTALLTTESKEIIAELKKLSQNLSKEVSKFIVEEQVQKIHNIHVDSIVDQAKKISKIVDDVDYTVRIEEKSGKADT